jgi:hypothetical protein
MPNSAAQSTALATLVSVRRRPGLKFMPRVRPGRPRDRLSTLALRPLSRTELVEIWMTVDAAIWVGNANVSAGEDKHGFSARWEGPASSSSKRTMAAREQG